MNEEPQDIVEAWLDNVVEKLEQVLDTIDSLPGNNDLLWRDTIASLAIAFSDLSKASVLDGMRSDGAHLEIPEHKTSEYKGF